MNVMATKICRCCGEALPVSEFYVRRDSPNAKYRSDCKSCFCGRRALLPRIRKLVQAIKCRAIKAGMEFDLDPEKIVVPDRCPVLGIKLLWGWQTRERGYRDSSPSIDRIDNSRGYTHDNIVVVSHRANRLKSDAAISELEAVIAFYKARLA